MSTYSGGLWILGALGAVLMVGSLRNKLEMFLNVILRGIVGLLMIYFINFLMGDNVPFIGLGYNLLTFFVCGFLGVPGVLLLYGIQMYMQLF